MAETVQSYELNGGSRVTIVRPFEGGTYAAIVEQYGRYPEEGRVACNHRRREFLHLLGGSITVAHGGQTTELAPERGLMLEEGVRYSISGKGQVLVLVHDEPGGATEILAD